MVVQGCIAGVNPKDLLKITLFKVGVGEIEIFLNVLSVNCFGNSHYTFEARSTKTDLYTNISTPAYITGITTNDHRLFGELPKMSVIISNEDGFLTVAC